MLKICEESIIYGGFPLMTSEPVQEIADVVNPDTLRQTQLKTEHLERILNDLTNTIRAFPNLIQTATEPITFMDILGDFAIALEEIANNPEEVIQVKSAPAPRGCECTCAFGCYGEEDLSDLNIPSLPFVCKKCIECIKIELAENNTSNPDVIIKALESNPNYTTEQAE
jgi:hypothetical protein